MIQVGIHISHHKRSLLKKTNLDLLESFIMSSWHYTYIVASQSYSLLSMSTCWCWCYKNYFTCLNIVRNKEASVKNIIKGNKNVDNVSRLNCKPEY